MKYQYILGFIILFTTGCKKFLDERQDKSQAIPTTLADAQQLLNRDNVLITNHPMVGECSSDNYFVTDANYNSIPAEFAKAPYLWEPELYFQNYQNDWSYLYSGVYIVHIAMETLSKVQRTADNAQEYDNVEGQAFFHRAHLYLCAALNWAKAYDPSYAASTPGIPLRMTTDFNEPSVRATLEATYRQIESDILNAIPRLPIESIHPIVPAKIAAYGLASRLYMAMGIYDKAGKYADSALQLKKDLLDYNTVNGSPENPFVKYNKEVLFVSTSPIPSLISSSRGVIDTILYSSYAANDLRKTLYFKNTGNQRAYFRGNYTGGGLFFCGIALDEIILNKAEAFARSGDVQAAMNDLNTLLIKRFKTGTFIPLQASSAQQALTLVLEERRKELLMRDLRWMDLKRLNRQPQFAKTLQRKLNNQLYELPPNSPRYALPLPAVVIALSGMQQNER